MRRLLGISAARVLAALAYGALALPSAARADPARDIYVGVYLHDVARLELKEGFYDVDFELWAKWRGEFDREQLQIANAASVERRFLGEEADRDWHTARWRVRGTLRGEFPMHRFPFDEQTIGVLLELPEEQGRLVPDAAGSGMEERFSLTDWLYRPEFHPRVEERTVASDLGLLASEGLPSTVHRVAYLVRLERPLVPVLLKLFLPLFIIGLVAYIGLFLSGGEIEARSSIGVTALLSCFAFQFTVADTLPPVAYLTLADTLFLIAYVFSTLGLLTSVVSHALEQRERERASMRLDRAARIALPLVAGVAVAFALPEPPPPPEPVPTPFPEMARAPSSRETLRIGVTRLSSILASPTYRGTHWQLVKTTRVDGEEARWPVLTSRLPGIDNELVRFLASGELEVTWPLRSDLRWSDGEPLRPRDLTLSWDLYPDDDVVAVKADEEALVVRWSGRLAAALDSPTVLPSHVLEPLFGEGGEEGHHAVKEHQRHGAPPTFGPYVVDEYERDARLVAVANEHFPGPPPNIGRVEVQVYESSEALLAAFEAGEMDLSYPNSISLEEAHAVAGERPDAVVIRSSEWFIHLHPDLTHPALSRLEVRRALMMALDREALAHAAYGEAGEVAHTPIARLSPAALTPIPYDPEAARVALARERVNELTLRHEESAIDRAVAAAMVSQLRAAGVALRTEEVRRTSQLRGTRHGGLVMAIMRGSRDANPHGYWNLPYQGGHYDDSVRNDAYTDDVDELVVRVRHALYPERRDQLRDSLFALVGERLPIMPLFFAVERILADPSLEGWNLGSGVRFGEGLERWVFREEHELALRTR